MKVQTAMFTGFLPFFGGTRESFNAEANELRDVQGTAGDRGLIFSRERDGRIRRIVVPYEQVRCWSPPDDVVQPAGIESRPAKRGSDGKPAGLEAGASK